jgi:hypothetical protein
LANTPAVFLSAALAEIGLTVWGRNTSSEAPSSGVLTLTPSSGRPAVSYVAHVMGAVAGLATGLLLLGPIGRRRGAANDRCTCIGHRQHMTDLQRLRADRKEQCGWA